MGQSTATAVPAATRIDTERISGQAFPLRLWGPRILIVALMAVGFLLANTQSALRFEDGSGLPLSDLAFTITKAGQGWVMTMTWLAGVLSLIAVFVFPPQERFVGTIAASAGSLLVLTLPWYVATHAQAIDPKAVGLGLGLQGLAACFLAASAVPWFSLLWWNRQVPVLGPHWEKWLFVGPAAVWILALTVFPLAYAITTSKYAYRTGKVAKNIGWGNYRKLFNDVLFDPLTRGPAILQAALVFLAAAAVVVVVGIVRGALIGEKSVAASARRSLAMVPIVAIPILIWFLTKSPVPWISTSILDKDVGFTLDITYIFVTGAVLAELILGFLLALLFNREMRGRSVLRTLITLPIFATPVAIGYPGRTIFYEGGGPVNSFLEIFHIVPPPWLSNPFWARTTTMITDVWEWTPLVFIIALAGLQSLPQEVLEASDVDGGGWWQSLRYITLPLMAPILWLILLLRAVDAFKVFDLAVAMTSGGPGQATRYYSYLVYQTSRKQFFFGEAAAQAFLLLIIVVVLVSLLWGKISHVYEDDQGVTR